MKTDVRNVLLSVKAWDPGTARHSVERILDEYTKRWRRHELSAGSQLLLYEVRLNKGVSPDELVSSVKAAGGAHVTNVDVSPRRFD